ncbi:hypothetical protein RRG08_030209 [Elysia crispata]|uniref:Uncharacterized protein n=1 Tax=Elysia crispata TaxID=231223 RepID=A0AAE1E3Q3_9GAST|nr:hypothetical protein RRG08_030209 [Elysia crispata]
MKLECEKLGRSQETLPREITRPGFYSVKYRGQCIDRREAMDRKESKYPNLVQICFSFALVASKGFPWTAADWFPLYKLPEQDMRDLGWRNPVTLQPLRSGADGPGSGYWKIKELETSAK